MKLDWSFAISELIFRLTVAATLLCIGHASAGEIDITRRPFYAVPDDGRDDTAAIQRALNVAGGNVVRFPDGQYNVSGTLRTPADCDYTLDFDPGAVLVAAGFDGPVLQVTSHTNSLNRYRNVLWNVAIRGKLPGDPIGVGKQHGIYCVGGGGANGYAAHGLLIKNARVERLSGSGIHLVDVYGANVEGAWVQWNGIGVYCRSANGTTFLGLSAKYNFYGYENIQSLIGGIVEGNMSSGGRYTELGVRYSVHDVWFEQNNLRNFAGSADIDAGDPAGPWKPVVVSLSGSTTFHNSYSLPGIDERTVPTHNITLNGYLTLSGAVRFFYPNKWGGFPVKDGSYVTDSSAGNPMGEVTNGFVGKVNYFRPALNGEQRLADLEKRLAAAEKRLATANPPTPP